MDIRRAYYTLYRQTWFGHRLTLRCRFEHRSSSVSCSSAHLRVQAEYFIVAKLAYLWRELNIGFRAASVLLQWRCWQRLIHALLFAHKLIIMKCVRLIQAHFAKVSNNYF